MEKKSKPVELPGLAEAEVVLRLQQHGYNELPSSKGRSIFATAWDVVREPMFLLLLACGTIYLILGDVQEAVMLLGFVFVVLGITLYQERKTERALEALRDLSSPRALVIRGGERKRIAGRDVVPDDLVVLAEGDRVPADSVVLSCNNLSTDESLLTGESVPVRKVAWDGVREMTRPGGEDLPFVFSGTLIVQGQGIAQVRSTGNEGGPFGAVIVKDAKIVGRGWNQVTSTNDPTAHAEVVAIRDACSHLKTFSLAGCEIYSSCEPCPLCLSAIYWSRLDRIYYAATCEDAAAAGFDDRQFYREVRKPSGTPSNSDQAIHSTSWSSEEATAAALNDPRRRTLRGERTMRPVRSSGRNSRRKFSRRT